LYRSRSPKRSVRQDSRRTGRPCSACPRSRHPGGEREQCRDRSYSAFEYEKALKAVAAAKMPTITVYVKSKVHANAFSIADGNSGQINKPKEEPAQIIR
jgi:hypothetical protein